MEGVLVFCYPLHITGLTFAILITDICHAHTFHLFLVLNPSPIEYASLPLHPCHAYLDNEA